MAQTTGRATARQNPRGGVHPRMHTGATHGAAPVAGHRARRHAAGSFPNFTYNGGPVIASPQVFSSYWGSLWSDAAHQQRMQTLDQYLTDLVGSPFMNVLSQYGVGPGVFKGRTAVASVPTVLTEAQIHSILQAGIDNGTFPEPGNPSELALIVFLDENIGVNDTSDPNSPLILCEPTNDDAFGYHSFFTTQAGHLFYYAIIPALSDQCIAQTCPDDNPCSLHRAQSQEQRITQVTSHEFAEMTTDPALNAWFDPDRNTGENGDICNGESDTITVGANTWTVQRIYSKQDDIQTGGQTFCRASAPAPLPLLPGGP